MLAVDGGETYLNITPTIVSGAPPEHTVISVTKSDRGFGLNIDEGGIVKTLPKIPMPGRSNKVPGPAEAAGVTLGSFILAVDGVDMGGSKDQISAALKAISIGNTVQLTVGKGQAAPTKPVPSPARGNTPAHSSVFPSSTAAAVAVEVSVATVGSSFLMEGLLFMSSFVLSSF